MNVRVLERKNDSMKVLLEKAEPSFANALRRVLIADVPKMAIEDVEFHLGPIRGDDGKEYESVAPLFDEIIAHRLGLVPIPTDLTLYNVRATCPTCHGEGCPSCTIIYSINKRGPGLVTSGDLEPIGDAKLRPTDANIPIVKLGDGQAMLVYATAVLGSGKDHAKWQPTHGVGYEFVPILKAGAKTVDTLDPTVPFCRSHMTTTSFDEISLELDPDCKTCTAFMSAYKVDTVKAGNDPSRVLLQFETDGSIGAKQVFATGLDILAKRFAELSEQVEALG
ncbi:MAG TPA: DNA-directed RNA polymerase subunit D [Thermoplasmata archaeon]|nr:DNA-directed RNA polymerase subunit D [Thermoplasmata archaeon]